VSRAPIYRAVLLLLGWGVVGTAALLGYMVTRINAQGARDEQRPADAIVVLGAAQFNGIPSDVFEARLRHAVDLWKAGVAPYFVVTGGKLPGDRTTEGATAKAWAIAHGVPESHILGEFQGRNTLESLEAVAALFREHHLTSAVFVSDETHMLRVVRMATDLGIEAYGSPTRTSPSDQVPARRTKATAHEVAGLVAYFLGAGHLFQDTAGGETTIASP
jgi:uncharacterized SAM-binding protein YcdF (DUF218 family)